MADSLGCPVIARSAATRQPYGDCFASLAMTARTAPAAPARRLPESRRCGQIFGALARNRCHETSVTNDRCDCVGFRGRAVLVCQRRCGRLSTSQRRRQSDATGCRSNGCLNAVVAPLDAATLQAGAAQADPAVLPAGATILSMARALGSQTRSAGFGIYTRAIR